MVLSLRHAVASIVAVVALLSLGCCSLGQYQVVAAEDIQQTFVANSSSTFKGYLYEGSDDEFHYFVAHWSPGTDVGLKVPRSALYVSSVSKRGTVSVVLRRVVDEGAVPFATGSGVELYTAE